MTIDANEELKEMILKNYKKDMEIYNKINNQIILPIDKEI